MTLPSPPLFQRRSGATGKLLSACWAHDPVAATHALALGADPKWSISGETLLLRLLGPSLPGSALFATQDRDGLLAEMVSMLVNAGAPLVGGASGEPVLVRLLLNHGDCPRTLALLLAAGCDPNEARAGRGDGAVEQAIWSKATQSLEVLLANGASPDGVSSTTIASALSQYNPREHPLHPSSVNALALSRRLLCAGANPNGNGVDLPLAHAIENHLDRMALDLGAAGASWDLASPSGHTPRQLLERRIASGQIESADDFPGALALLAEVDIQAMATATPLAALVSRSPIRL
jgi:hypothetical protein